MSRLVLQRLMQVALALVLFVFGAVPRATAGVTSLVLVSEPGDFVGQGQSLTYAPPAAAFSGQAHIWVGYPQGGQSLTMTVTTAVPGDGWSLYFAAPMNAQLTPGVYAGATGSSSPTSTVPTLNVSGQGRGCHGVGSFVVLEVAITPAHEVTVFRAIFEQRCGSTQPALRGEIRYNATVPFEMSAPTVITALAGQQVTFGVTASGGVGPGIALSVPNLPPGATFTDHGNNSGTFAWSTGPEHAGLYTVEFRGQDTDGATQPTYTAVRIRPPNDDIGSAITLAGMPAAGTRAGTTAGATMQAMESPHGFAGAGTSIWFKFTVAIAERVVFDTIGSANDMFVAVYADTTPLTPASFTQLSSVAGTNAPGPGRVVFTATPGNVYYVAVDASYGAVGSFTLNWRRAELTRLLWRHSDGSIAIWRIDSGGTIVSHPIFGPFSGWEAMRLAVGPDRKTRILWRHTSGLVSLWTLGAADTLEGHRTFGPFDGWTVSDLAIPSDGNIHLAWRHDNGAHGLWVMTPDASSVTSSTSYGPYAAWHPVAIGVDSDFTRQILWRTDNGAISVWHEPAPYGSPSSFLGFGPYTGWTPVDLAAGHDWSARILWRHSTGAVGLWRLAPGGTVLAASYGPYDGWEGVALALPNVSPTWGDFHPRILWRHSGGGIALWKTSVVGDTVTSKFSYGPFTGWTAIDVAVGPE
jgi:hypothetical protein